MKKFFGSVHFVWVVISLAVGFVLAVLFKDDLTPLLAGGTAFSVRSLPVKTVLLLSLTGFFGLVVYVLMYLNRTANETGSVKPAAFLGMIGGLTGALIFYLIYGTGTLDTGRVDWLFNLGDNAQHYLGWVFYRNDPWTWPIGFSCSLGYPTGTCMCFTDSIPLLAIPFKLISFLLPPVFQYFGLWTLLCFFLQGTLAAMILYEVTGKRLPAMVAPLFFCTADILLFRVFRYTPLTGQWIVLFALYLYFLNRRTGRWNKLWPLVHIMAVLIQGYFFVMTFVVQCGTILERYLSDHRWIPAVRDLLVSLASTALVMWVVGFFTAAVEMSNTGLGYFKANLNAFINPLPGWSRFFPPLPLAEGTYAMNVNYLGAGIILLVVIGLGGMFFRGWNTVRNTIRANWGLLLIIPVLVVFALSNVVTWNEHVLFTYNLPEPVMKLWGVFRGTERMLWPVYYLILVFAIGRAYTVLTGKWISFLLLIAAFGLQLAEVYPQLERFHAEFDDPQGKRTSLRSEFWDTAAQKYDSVVILPLELDNWARLTQYAADNHLKINYSYYARYSPDIEPAARQKIDELTAGQTVAGEMYILKSPELFHRVCGIFREPENFLGYIDGEWVLAPGLDGTTMDAAITGDRANCAGLSWPEFQKKYGDKLLVLAAMDDVSTLGIAPRGKSYIGIYLRGTKVYEDMAEKKIGFSVLDGRGIQGATLAGELNISSAGNISGEEDAVIQVGARDYSYHRNGLNVVVIDPDSGRVIDTALFASMPD